MARTLALSPTRPDRCAVACCLPLTLAEAKADFEAGHDRDFVRSVVREYPSTSFEGTWAAFLSAEMASVQTTLKEAEQAGVTVVQRATLAHVAALSRRFEVVTLLTHWRGGALFADQVRDLPGALQKVRSGEGVASKSVRAQLISDRIALSEVNAERFVSAANRSLLSHDLGPSRCPLDWHTSRHLVYREHANRGAFDSEFTPEVIPGNRIEFADGLRSAEDVAAAVAPDFQGVLDLTICNSIIAVEAIKLRYRFTCIGNREVIELGDRLALYAAVILVISSTKMNYVEAVREIRQSVLNTLRSKKDRS